MWPIICNMASSFIFVANLPHSVTKGNGKNSFLIYKKGSIKQAICYIALIYEKLKYRQRSKYF
jgi:hypothetical protein